MAVPAAGEEEEILTGIRFAALTLVVKYIHHTTFATVATRGLVTGVTATLAYRTTARSVRLSVALIYDRNNVRCGNTYQRLSLPESASHCDCSLI